MDTMMDDEDEQINTKGLSLRLHPNLPQHVCTVSQAGGDGGGERERERRNNDKAMWRLKGVDGE